MGDSESENPAARLRRMAPGTAVGIHRADGTELRGTVVAAHEFSGEGVVQLKLASGYNVGVKLRRDDQVTIDTPPSEIPEGRVPPLVRDRGPAPAGDGWVGLLTTGGTIASRVDYKTGGVRPVHGEQEILDFYPDLEQDGPVRVVPVFDRLSEEITPADWEVLARKVVDVFREGARGIVIAHGTDTLGFTAAALAFLLEDLPGPVVLVGAQRSPDRPSSDGPSNLAAAVRIARHPRLGEVVVVMHAGLSDDRFSVHRGTRVRKMHSSRRDAFRTRNGIPLATLDGSTLTFSAPFRERSSRGVKLSGPLDPRAAIVWFFPGLDVEKAKTSALGLRGVVLAGTGLGHVSSAHLPWIREAVQSGTVAVMTTQCLEGSVDPFVYATGRELLRAGVLYVGDILPETAYAKLLWALGRSEDSTEVRRLMLTDRAGENEGRHQPGALG